MPGQRKTFELLSRLLDIQTEASAEAVRDAQQDYVNTLIMAVILVLSGIALAAAIARLVTRRVSETEQRLHTATEQAQITLHSIGDGVITTDTHGLIKQINPEAAQLTGWAADTAIGQPLTQVFRAYRDPDTKKQVDPIHHCLRDQRVVNADTDIKLEADNGRSMAIEYTAAPYLRPEPQ